MAENRRVAGATEPQAFPPPPVPVAEQPVQASPDAPHYMIEHDGVDAWTKGQIVSRDQLGGAGVVERLLRVGAVVPCTAEGIVIPVYRG